MNRESLASQEKSKYSSPVSVPTCLDAAAGASDDFNMDLHAGEFDLTSADEDEEEEMSIKYFFRCTRDIRR